MPRFRCSHAFRQWVARRGAVQLVAAAAEATVVASTGAKEKAEAADGFPEASVSVENVHLNVVGECESRSGACRACTSCDVVHLMQSRGTLTRSAHTDSTLSPSLPCRVASKTSRYRTSLQQAAAKAPERMPIAAAGAVGGQEEGPGREVSRKSGERRRRVRGHARRYYHLGDGFTCLRRLGAVALGALPASCMVWYRGYR